MSFIRGQETIQIKRRTQNAVDEWGNASYSTTTITVKNVAIAIGTTSDDVDPARDAVDATVTLYLPNGTQVLDGDTFIVRGSAWQRAGEAENWVSPFGIGFETGVVVPLRRRRG